MGDAEKSKLEAETAAMEIDEDCFDEDDVDLGDLDDDVVEADG